jgi:hypothetical protein
VAHEIDAIELVGVSLFAPPFAHDRSDLFGVSLLFVRNTFYCFVSSSVNLEKVKPKPMKFLFVVRLPNGCNDIVTSNR